MGPNCPTWSVYNTVNTHEGEYLPKTKSFRCIRCGAGSIICGGWGDMDSICPAETKEHADLRTTREREHWIFPA